MEQNKVALSFGGGKKPVRKIEVHEKKADVRKEAVTGFGEGGLQTAEPKPSEKGAPLVIPKLENTYRGPGGKFVPSFIPEASDQEVEAAGINKFETAAHDTAVAQQEVTYGLQKRARPPAGKGGGAALAEKGGAAPEQQQKQQGQGQQGRDGAGGSALGAKLLAERDREAQQLREDLAHLPEQASLEAYEVMPVEQFGMALMRGMGWSEGRAIGRNAKEEVQARELVRRPQRLGLGAAPAPEQQEKKRIRPGESREPKPDLVYVDAQGRQSNSRPVGEALTERRREGVHPGKVMRVAEGRHSGLLCEVVALEPKQEGRSERARVRLLPSYETVSVRCSELAERDAAAPADERRRPGSSSGREREGELEHSDRGRDRSRREQRDAGADDAEQRQEGKRARWEGERGARGGGRGSPPAPAPPRERPWLAPNIRVKIVDKGLKGGRLYLKKGSVVDVKSPLVCDVFLDKSRQPVLDVHQSQLETVVPGVEGTPLLVLAGEFKGRRGRLLKRNTETGLAAVQLTSDGSVHRLSLDDVCEYTGPTDTWDE